MIILKRSLYHEILLHAQAGLPNEACGILAGTMAGPVKVVEKIYPMKNVDQSPEHFSLDPVEQFSVLKDAREKGLVLLGNFHSHPETPSRPSEEDKRLAFDPEASYFIVSLMNPGEPVLKSFRIAEGTVEEEKMEIV